MKTCIKCDTPKPLDDFYAKLTACKECHKLAVRQRRLINPAVQEYDRQRSKLPHRVAHNKQNMQQWRARYPEKYRAHNAVNNAIRDGRLKRGVRCEECGKKEHLHAHHDDYSKPLDVRWLCARCHHQGHQTF
jgi:ribosome-binding protein aMBF1 (putative translation factor)